MDFCKEGIIIFNRILRNQGILFIFNGNLNKFFDKIYNYNNNHVFQITSKFNIFPNKFYLTLHYTEIYTNKISISNNNYYFECNNVIIEFNDNKYIFKIRTDSIYDIYNEITQELINKVKDKLKYNDDKIKLLLNIFDIIEKGEKHGL